MITEQEREYLTERHKVYIYDEIGAREILADLTTKESAIINKDGKFIGSKTKYALENIRFYPAGELLVSILLVDDAAIKTKIKKAIGLDDDAEIVMPPPFEDFGTIFGYEIIYTVNCISAVREFIDLLETNTKKNIQIWLRALWVFLGAWDYIPEYGEQIEATDIYEGCTWENEKRYETINKLYQKEFDVLSLDFDAFRLKECLPGYVDIYEDEEDCNNKFPNFSLEIKTPEQLIFASLEQCCTHDILIKKCKNCGKYFIPQNRSDTLYCDRKAPQDEAKTCKEYGARQAWRTTLKENETAGLYRKIYMSKQMLCKRNPDVKEYTESFEKYKEQAKKWKANVKNGTKSEADYLEWLKAVKEKKVL